MYWFANIFINKIPTSNIYTYHSTCNFLSTVNKFIFSQIQFMTEGKTVLFSNNSMLIAYLYNVCYTKESVSPLSVIVSYSWVDSFNTTQYNTIRLPLIIYSTVRSKLIFYIFVFFMSDVCRYTINHRRAFEHNTTYTHKTQV